MTNNKNIENVRLKKSVRELKQEILQWLRYHNRCSKKILHRLGAQLL